jgi:hypothetical protein
MCWLFGNFIFDFSAQWAFWLSVSAVILGFLLVAVGKKSFRFIGGVLIVVAIVMTFWHAHQRAIDVDNLNDLLKTSEENARIDREARDRPTKTSEFVDGVPVIRDWYEALYYDGCRVIVFGTAEPGSKPDPYIFLTNGGQIDVQPVQDEWPAKLEKHAIKATGILTDRVLHLESIDLAEPNK